MVAPRAGIPWTECELHRADRLPSVRRGAPARPAHHVHSWGVLLGQHPRRRRSRLSGGAPCRLGDGGIRTGARRSRSPRCRSLDRRRTERRRRHVLSRARRARSGHPASRSLPRNAGLLLDSAVRAEPRMVGPVDATARSCPRLARRCTPALREVDGMNALRWLIAILLTCAAASPHQAFVYAAQIGASELRGVVRDETGAATPGALVTLIDERRQIYTTVADSEGAYLFRGLQPGTYDLNVMLAGFAPVTQRIVMTSQSRAGVDVKLRVAITERVNVVSSFEDFRRATGLSPVGMTLGPEQLGILPNDPDAMLMVLRELSATTGRADQVKVYVDGQPVTARLPPKEAIQSIRISTNSFASEFAEPSAGLVEIITKPASTSFRGDWQATFN